MRQRRDGGNQRLNNEQCQSHQQNSLSAVRPTHSITSSARASSIGGISKPSAFAAVRLIIVSYSVRASAGQFSPPMA
jgi:hypothetical protein